MLLLQRLYCSLNLENMEIKESDKFEMAVAINERINELFYRCERLIIVFLH
jgi:hypothetical protein